MEKIEWKVEGMDCTNCALTITKYLQKEGQQDVKVNFIGGDVSFQLAENKSKELEELIAEFADKERYKQFVKQKRERAKNRNANK